jgi:hypothetical protein
VVPSGVRVIAGPLPAAATPSAPRRLALLTQSTPPLRALEGPFGLAAKAPLRPRHPPDRAMLGTVPAGLLTRAAVRPLNRPIAPFVTLALRCTSAPIST